MADAETTVVELDGDDRNVPAHAECAAKLAGAHGPRSTNRACGPPSRSPRRRPRGRRLRAPEAGRRRRLGSARSDIRSGRELRPARRRHGFQRRIRDTRFCLPTAGGRERIILPANAGALGCAIVQRALSLVALALTSTACAFTNIPLTLPTKGLESTISGGRGRQVVVAVPFSDQRTLGDRCGMQKNGYNMDTAAAVCQSDPNGWIAQLLADELRASGFEVLTNEEPHRPGAVRIDGSLLKLFVEPVQGAWTGSLEADLSVKLRATSETGLDAERTFFVKGVEGRAARSPPCSPITRRCTVRPRIFSPRWCTLSSRSWTAIPSSACERHRRW